jgi:hypothetical protein
MDEGGGAERIAPVPLPSRVARDYTSPPGVSRPAMNCPIDVLTSAILLPAAELRPAVSVVDAGA